MRCAIEIRRRGRLLNNLTDPAVTERSRARFTKPERSTGQCLHPARTYAAHMNSSGDVGRVFFNASSLALAIGILGLIVSFGVTSQWGFPASAPALCRSSLYSSGALEDAGWAWIPFPVASCKTLDFDSAANYFALGWENSITAAVSLVVIATALKVKLSHRT